MGLVINNNLMAASTARILSNTYDRLNTSVQRLSSGLRINGAADDAAGLAIRELMRADILTMQQGIRNAADGISMLQTAEGAMAVIDEKLVRLKELAAQAASGTYTTVQREIINSEYQAMAEEIDRIANSANFNGVKLLDGSMSSIHNGKGIKIHFGTGNDPATDYYFIKTGDIRATSETGLRIGGDAKNDIWGTVGTHGGPNTTGCCGGGIPSLNEPVPAWKSGDVFSFGYNWDWKENEDTNLGRGRYIAGAWQVDGTPTLQELMDMVNKGSQARVRVDVEYIPDRYLLKMSGSIIDVTKYVTVPGARCPLAGRIVGDLPVDVANAIGPISNATGKPDESLAAGPPLLCYGNTTWPPADLFYYETQGTPSGFWRTKADGYRVEFSGFTVENMTSASDPPVMLVYGADNSTVVSKIYLSSTTTLPLTNFPTAKLFWDSAAVTGSGWAFAPNYPNDELVGNPAHIAVIRDGDRIMVNSGATSADVGQIGVKPIFALDGITVPDSFVEWDRELEIYKIKINTELTKIEGHAATLADLLEKSYHPVPTSVNPVNVLVDANGNAQYELNASGAAIMNAKYGKYSSGMVAPAGGLTPAMLTELSALTRRSGVTIILDPTEAAAFTLAGPGQYIAGQVVTLDGTLTGLLPSTDFKTTDIIRSLNQAEADALNRADPLYAEGTDIDSRDFLDLLVTALISAGVTGNPNHSLADGKAVIFPNNLLNSPVIVAYMRTRPVTDNTGKPFSASNLMGQIMDYFGQNLWRTSSYTSSISYNEGAHRVCIGDEIYYIGSATMGQSTNDVYKYAFSMSAALHEKGNPFGGYPPARDWETVTAICALAYAINNNPNSKFWARIEEHVYNPGFQSLYIFAKEGGDKSHVAGCDEQMGNIRGDTGQYNRMVWYNDEMETMTSAGTYFNNGGQKWGTLEAIPTGYGSWGVQLSGRDVGKERDLWILNVGAEPTADINTGQKTAFTGKGFGYVGGQAVTNLLGLDRYSFVEIQNADDGPWAGAHLRTQSDAQEAMDAIQGAIERKDKVRATLGAYINRLENTITNLEIQIENLQAAESRISDVDMATEMTEFVRNQILTQAAVSMLSQANSLPQMALSLLNG